LSSTSLLASRISKMRPAEAEACDICEMIKPSWASGKKMKIR
jgi:hypothetical protein